MPKTLKDKIAMLSAIVSLASLFIGHVIPPAWLQGITAWRFCFGLSCIVLLVWAVDRFIIEPIRQAIAAISSVGSGNSEPLFPDILNRSVAPGKGSSNLR